MGRATVMDSREARLAHTYGIVLFDDFELLDVFGPAEAFGMLRHFDAGNRLLMISEHGGEVRSAQGPRVLADHAFADCPPLDLLLLPGGAGTRAGVDDETQKAFLRTRATSTELMTSVCSGSAVFAAAGLLDGKRATSNKRSWKWIVSQGPAVEWVPEARWVTDGKYMTSAGVSAGIDMALAAVERLEGAETATQVAAAMEYDWHRDAAWDPFAKLNGLV